MKAFVLTALLAACFSSNLMAQETKCYTFHPNEQGYNKFCVTLADVRPDNTKATVEIFKNDKLVSTIPGERVHNDQQRVCYPAPQNYCHRKYEALRILAKNETFDMEVFMRVSKRSTCLYGKVAVTNPVKNISLDVNCPNLSWGNIEN